MKIQNPYAPPNTDPHSETVVQSQEYGLLHRMFRYVGIVGGLVGSIGAFASSANHYQQDRMMWSITAFGSGCIVLGAVIHLIRRNATNAATHPMQSSDEVGRIEDD